MGMNPLGMTVDQVPTASGVLLSLRYAAGVMFTCVGADTYTLKSATAYNCSPTTLADIDLYYTNASAAGADQWADVTQAAADAITIDSGVAAFYVDAADLPADALWVSCTAGDSGLVQATLVGFSVQRDPARLPVRSGSAS